MAHPLAILGAKFSYNPSTGELKRGARLVHSTRPYPIVIFGGMKIPIHRLIWALYSGHFPPSNMVVDHINRNPFDNRAENLRLVHQSENLRNTRRSLRRTKHRANGEPINVTIETL